MLGLVQDIFDLDAQPGMLNVRHLFTSIGNVIMPENNMVGTRRMLCFHYGSDRKEWTHPGNWPMYVWYLVGEQRGAVI
jgi:hypothetical protein